MVNSNRIEELLFPTQIISAASSGFRLFSQAAINGEVVEVQTTASQNGSLALATSGLGAREIWRLNASSGTSPTVNYPGHLMQDTTGSGAGFGGTVQPFMINDKLMLTTGSLASGTLAAFQVTVLYRK